MLHFWGSDSDVMLNICWKCDINKKIDYVWFNTGLEYQATKDHLKYLEERYGIEIKVYKAIKPIPLTCKQYGQPFVSKRVSNYIRRLQYNDFDFARGDRSFDELYAEYPHCKAALSWWCNLYDNNRLNINFNKYLKTFLIKIPPQFQISDVCCDYAKKKVAHKCVTDGGYELSITGLRKAEGGTRATAYKSCFDEDVHGCDQYRPLFWYTNDDKKAYEEAFNIKHSACYTLYGLKRTGCVGCPFGRQCELEINVVKEYEPKLYHAINNIFGDSYEYTRKYHEFAYAMRQMENLQSPTIDGTDDG